MPPLAIMLAHVHVHADTPTCMLLYLYTYMHTHTTLYAHSHACTHMQTHDIVCTQSCMYTHMHTHTYTHDCVAERDTYILPISCIFCHIQLFISCIFCHTTIESSGSFSCCYFFDQSIGGKIIHIIIIIVIIMHSQFAGSPSHDYFSSGHSLAGVCGFKPTTMPSMVYTCKHIHTGGSCLCDGVPRVFAAVLKAS